MKLLGFGHIFAEFYIIEGSLILLLGRGDNNYDKRAMPLAVFFVLSFITILVRFM